MYARCLRRAVIRLRVARRYCRVPWLSIELSGALFRQYGSAGRQWWEPLRGWRGLVIPILERLAFCDSARALAKAPLVRIQFQVMHRGAFSLLVLLVCGATSAAGQTPGPAEGMGRTGEQIFKAACVACHGPDGKGQPQSVLGFEPPASFPDFTDCRRLVGRAGRYLDRGRPPRRPRARPEPHHAGVPGRAHRRRDSIASFNISIRSARSLAGRAAT